VSAARFLVSGKVQGVSFRAGTRAQAAQLGLRGHARNQSDGSVEVLAAGNSAAIDALETWLRQGPSLAQVQGLLREDLAQADVPDGFRIG
jgi:acylphosphatase